MPLFDKFRNYQGVHFPKDKRNEMGSNKEGPGPTAYTIKIRKNQQ